MTTNEPNRPPDEPLDDRIERLGEQIRALSERVRALPEGEIPEDVLREHTETGALLGELLTEGEIRSVYSGIVKSAADEIASYPITATIRTLSGNPPIGATRGAVAEYIAALGDDPDDLGRTDYRLGYQAGYRHRALDEQNSRADWYPDYPAEPEGRG